MNPIETVQRAESATGRRHRVVLIGLLSAFALRVLAQLLQAVAPTELLPDFDAFESGALPYPALLIAQLAILAVGIVAITRVGPTRSTRLRPPRSGPPRPWPRWALTVLTLFGVGYFLTMVFRGWFGLLEQSAGSWFDEPIPTVFHLVLAVFVLTAAHHWWRAMLAAAPCGLDDQGRSAAAEMAAVTLYPATLGSAFAAYAALQGGGVPRAPAAYLAVAVATATILAAEWRWPARASWQPERGHVANDVAFMAAIQVLLPAALALTATGLLDSLAADLDLQLSSLWPHGWPLVAQVIAMLLIGDVFRYWLHRLSHRPNVLWRLHAVHHSPDRLYSLNVARFHPFDKALQYLFDTLPFVLLAVDRRVLLAYFVFYAVNGFFQHCNCHIRLGPLNWIVSGPELHRWHHSEVIVESDNNFGNNLIVWDVLFGTRFLPDDRHVGRLGLLNRSYPTSFPAQMTSVFVPGLDKHPLEPNR